MIFDHMIVPARDKEEAAEFYANALGVENLGSQAGTPFHAVRINEDSVLLFLNPKKGQEIPSGKHHLHFALTVSPGEFEELFARIRNSGIPYGDQQDSPDNMKGPGASLGARGFGKAVYFKDPSGNLVEIRTY